MIGLRQFLKDKGEQWSDKLLIINLVAYRDSLAVEQQLAQFEVVTQEDNEFKSLMTAINRGEIQISGTGKAALSNINKVANNQQSRHKTMAESALANYNGISFKRNAPKRNKKFSTDKAIIKDNLYCYPNPTKDLVTLTWDQFDLQKLDELGSINIFSINGHLTKQIETNDFNIHSHGITFNVRELNRGIYFLQLEGKSGCAKLFINN